MGSIQNAVNASIALTGASKLYYDKQKEDKRNLMAENARIKAEELSKYGKMNDVKDIYNTIQKNKLELAKKDLSKKDINSYKTYSSLSDILKPRVDEDTAMRNRLDEIMQTYSFNKTLQAHKIANTNRDIRSEIETQRKIESKHRHNKADLARQIEATGNKLGKLSDYIGGDNNETKRL